MKYIVTICIIGLFSWTVAFFSQASWPVEKSETGPSMIMKTYPEVTQLYELDVNKYRHIHPWSGQAFIARHKDGSTWFYDYRFVTAPGYRNNNRIFKHEIERRKVLSSKP